MPKVLVAIANHGTGNRHYLDRLIATYAAMRHAVHVVVLSNIPKDLGPDVEVRVGVPSSNPWSLPFAHRRLFRERLEEYDLFIYSEDDTLIEQSHIDAFLEVSQLMEDDMIPGFLRYEEDAGGQRYVSSIHSHFRWDPGVMFRRNGLLFARHTNEHAACFIATREQLRRAIASGGFVEEPYEARYDMLCTAATDIYTRCGMQKVICVSRVDDFLVHHLPNKYIGRMGVPYKELERQIEAIEAVAREEGSEQQNSLLNAETRIKHARWSKCWYECGNDAFTDLVPKGARVLSIGCGYGGTEEYLMQRGHEVTAVPIDPVAGRFLRGWGIETTAADFEEAASELGGREFDVVLLRDFLHLCEDPVWLLRFSGKFLTPQGIVIASCPNTCEARTRWNQLKGQFRIGDYKTSGVHASSIGRVRKWMDEAGLRVQFIAPQYSKTRQPYARILGKLAGGLLAYSFIVQAGLGSKRELVEK